MTCSTTDSVRNPCPEKVYFHDNECRWIGSNFRIFSFPHFFFIKFRFLFAKLLPNASLWYIHPFNPADTNKRNHTDDLKLPSNSGFLSSPSALNSLTTFVLHPRPNFSSKAINILCLLSYFESNRSKEAKEVISPLLLVQR